MMAGPPVYPNYNATTHILLSPVLYDPATVIGLSGVILAGSVGDINGVPVGTSRHNVGQSQLVLQPAGLEPVGTREVHSMVYSLNMTGGGAAVRSGIQAPNQPISPGEIESLLRPLGHAGK